MSLTAPCFNFDHPTLGAVATALNPVEVAWEMLIDPSPAMINQTEYETRWREALADALEKAAAVVRVGAGPARTP